MDIYHALFTIGFFLFVYSAKNQGQEIYCLKDTECELPMHAENITYEAVHWTYKQSDSDSDTKIGYWYEKKISLKNGYNKTVLVEKRGEKDMHLKLKNATSSDTGIYKNAIVLTNAAYLTTENKLYVIYKAWTACVDDKKQLYNKTIDLNSSTDLVRNLTESYKDNKIQKIQHACSKVSEYQKNGCYILGEFVNGEKQCLQVETGPCTCLAEYARNRTLEDTSDNTGKDANIGIIVGSVAGAVVIGVIIIIIVVIRKRKKGICKV